MKGHAISIAEGKKDFSRIIEGAVTNKEDVVVTKRGKPVAVIISYDEYVKVQRRVALQKILEARKEFAKAGLNIEEIVRESRRELEERL